MATTMPTHSLKHLPTARPWLSRLKNVHKLRFSTATSSVTSLNQHPQQSQPIIAHYDDNNDDGGGNRNNRSNDYDTKRDKPSSYFPKKNQSLELECESLAFKGKGVCRVAETGFVVMCDRALPGERFIGRVTRKKGSYAEVTKVKTISPHWDFVDAPCEYASYCGGCKTQNLSYEAQLRAKEQQVRELVVNIAKFSDKNPEFVSIMKPIVPCDIQFHYRNKMEFSFGSHKWWPRELLDKKQDGNENYALGLHAPGFFDKILNVNQCLLQSQPANVLSKIVGGIQNFALLHMTSALMLGFLSI